MGPSPPTLKGPVGPCCYSFHSTLEAQSSTTCVTSVNTVPLTKVNLNLNLPTTVLLTCKAALYHLLALPATQRCDFYTNFFTTFGISILNVISIKAPPCHFHRILRQLITLDVKINFPACYHPLFILILLL